MLLLPVRSWAAWGFVQADGNTAAASSTTIAVTQTSNPTAGNLLIVFAKSNSVTTSPTVADSRGNTYIEIAAAKNTTAVAHTAFYAKNAIGGGANTVTVTFNSADTARVILVAEYSGLSTTAPLDSAISNNQGAPGTGTDAITSTTLTVAGSGELLVGFASNEQGTFNTFAAGTGFTQRFNGHPGGGDQIILEDSTPSSGSRATTVTTSTDGGDTYGTQAIAFLLPGSASASGLILLGVGK